MPVTDADRAMADTICNPKDDPHLHNVLCKKFAKHRRDALEEAAGVCDYMAEETLRAIRQRPRPDAHTLLLLGTMLQVVRANAEDIRALIKDQDDADNRR